MKTAGYSGTPLARKLGIKENSRLFLQDAPPNYLELVAPLPPGVKLVSRIDATTDIVHLFVTFRASLSKICRHAMERLRPDGTIWVSWPKKASGVRTDVTEDAIREIALPMGLVDVKVCAVNETWSGLKLVLRKENRHRAPARAAKGVS
ncbi:MAG TPA: DUF3052 family protein [Steroidobacteraceae bacterium]|nr:DUF3052 family protein [Steroidobacteraceae bacterium]